MIWGHPRCAGVDEMGQNVVIIQVLDPALIPAHPTSIVNRKVAFSKHTESPSGCRNQLITLYEKHIAQLMAI